MKPKADFRSQFRMSLYFSFGLLFFAQALGATPKLPTSDTSYEIPSEDESYKYYLGVSDGTETVKDGMTEAFDQAAQEAIRENFGVFTQIDTDSYATEKESQVLRRFKQQSGEIALKGFEKIDSKVIKNTTTNKYQVQALYRYNKIAIKQELARLESKEDLPPEADPGISVIGSLDNEDLGGLRVSTKPPAASIFLNDEPYLKSPIDIVNQIPPGKYTLKIDHPHFDTVTEEILILANRTTKITKVLKPAHSRLSLSSTPPGADVRINGKLVGKTPLVEHKLLAGQAMRVDLSHKDAYGMSLHAYSVEKDQLREESLEMKLKPGSILLSINAPGAAISIDGQAQPLRQRRFRLPAGTHRFEVSAPGYIALTNIFEIHGNRTLSERMELEKVAPARKAYLWSDNTNAGQLTETPPLTPSPWYPSWYTTSSTSDIASQIYFSLGGSVEAISNPVLGKRSSTGTASSSITSSESNSNSQGTNLSLLLEAALGLRNGLGIHYSIGSISKTSGPGSEGISGPLVAEANRSKFGVTWNFESNKGELFQIGGETEVMDAEVVTTLSTGGSTWPGSFKMRTRAKLNGRGFFMAWVGRQMGQFPQSKLA
ncbi:MAG: PEGA domain-containing protein [Bdellovibrionales bacterium]|nr:PEGA domain-containing protein [Bdellovibrionales bacterium]